VAKVGSREDAAESPSLGWAKAGRSRGEGEPGGGCVEGGGVVVKVAVRAEARLSCNIEAGVGKAPPAFLHPIEAKQSKVDVGSSSWWGGRGRSV